MTEFFGRSPDGGFVVDWDRSNAKVLGCYLDKTGFAAVVAKVFVKKREIEWYKIIDEFVDLNDECNLSSLKSNLHDLINRHDIEYILGNKTAERLKGSIRTFTGTNNIVRSGWETVSLNLESAYLELNKNLLRDDRVKFVDSLYPIWYEELLKYDQEKAENGKSYLRIFALFNIIDNIFFDYNGMLCGDTPDIIVNSQGKRINPYTLQLCPPNQGFRFNGRGEIIEWKGERPYERQSIYDDLNIFKNSARNRGWF